MENFFRKKIDINWDKLFIKKRTNKKTKKFSSYITGVIICVGVKPQRHD